MNEIPEFDAIVIGSGFAGAVTACRLAEAGKDTCILERGRRYETSELPVLNDERFGELSEDPDASAADRSVPDLTGAFWNLGQGLWDVRDLEELIVAQAAGYGGGSLIYANVHLRAPDDVFDTWPQQYDRLQLDDYYDLAAYRLDVQTVPEPLQKTAQLELAGHALSKQFFRPFRPPLAVNFGRVRENNYGAKLGTCDMQGNCCFGCPEHAKNTLDLNYLRTAEERGAAVYTLAEVVSIERMETKHKKRRFKVSYRDHLARGRIRTVAAEFVFLCAGAVNTTELLLRNCEAGNLQIESEHLGSGYYPNADELAAVFDCNEEQEADRGPTISTSLLYDDGAHWLLIQDGGMPAHLEPLLGIFRSPLWLHRNGFANPPGPNSDAITQRPAYAELPVQALADTLSGLTGSAIGKDLPIAHDLSESFLAFAEGGGDLESMLVAAEDAQTWKLLPDQFAGALDQLRKGLLDDLAFAAIPTVDRFLRETAGEIPDGLLEQLKDNTGQFPLGNVTERELREWAFRFAVQLVWGSETGMVQSIVRDIGKNSLPERRKIVGALTRLLSWALDYRVPDGHTALLLSFGRDSTPGRLELAATTPPVGSRVTGDESGASGILVSISDGVLVLAGVDGKFKIMSSSSRGTRPSAPARPGSSRS